MKNMNIVMNLRLLAGLLVFAFLLGVAPVQAQEDEPISSRMSLSFFKDSDQNRILTATLKYRDEDRKWQLIEGAEVIFSAGSEDEIELGKSVSDANGNAVFVIPREAVIPVDTSTNLTLYLANFEGNEQFEGSDGEIEIKDIELTMKLEVVDSVKMVYVEAFEINYNEEMIPIEECDITLFVPRLYSYLPLEEGSIEEGMAEFQFPDDIPGRDNGELFISARITEHDEYGTVEVKQEVNWGVPVAFVNEEMPVSLYGKAPIWMGIAIFGVLIGAWYHLFLVLFKLFRIKRIAKN